MKTHLKPDIRVKEEVLEHYIRKHKGVLWLAIILAFGAFALLLLSIIAHPEAHSTLASSFRH